MARYGQAYKDRVVARLLPPESTEVDEISRAIGVSVPTLLRWRADALATASGERLGAGSPRWTAAARRRIPGSGAACSEASATIAGTMIDDVMCAEIRAGFTAGTTTSSWPNSALRAWIMARNRPGPLLVRRDPRDLSRVFLLDPLDGGYLEVPTRDLSRPAISLWEHRLARRRLRAKHRGEIDEGALFAAIEEMRAAEKDAARLTRSARRDRTRRARAPDLPAAPPSAEPAKPAPVAELAALADDDDAELPRPFDDISHW